MGLLSGTLSCTRMNVVAAPERVEFQTQPFRSLQKGSSLTQSQGFIPFELDEPFDVWPGGAAFRVRIDTLIPDATLLRERLKELVKIETEQVGRPSLRRLRQLKDQAEDELRAQQSPKTKIIECVLDHHILYIGSTAKQHLGSVIALMRNVGVELAFKTPWLEQGEDQEPPAFLKIRDPAQSVLGCQFLRHLLNQPDIFLECQRGFVKLVTADGSDITLRGAVTSHVNRFLAEDTAFMVAKIIVEDAAFQFDAFSYRISGLKGSDPGGDHWIEKLEARLDQLKAVWDFLDERYYSWTK